jgi:hypothetical protein
MNHCLKGYKVQGTKNRYIKEKYYDYDIIEHCYTKIGISTFYLKIFLWRVVYIQLLHVNSYAL